MDIPLKNTLEKDIYSYGFDAGLNRPITDNSTGVVYDAVGDSLNAAQMLQGGNLTLKTLSIGGLFRQVAPGDDIQAAIEAVSRDGGGEVRLTAGTHNVFSNITMRSSVTLQGSGRGVTIIDFNDTASKITGAGISNFKLAGLTVQNSSTHGIHFGNLTQSVSNFEIEDVYSTSNGGSGVYILSAFTAELNNVEASTNTSHGFHLQGTGIVVEGPVGAGGNESVTFIRCAASGNGGTGINIDHGSGVNKNINLISCTAVDNTGDGFVIGIEWGSMVGCKATGNANDFSFGYALGVTLVSPIGGTFVSDSISTGNLILAPQGTISLSGLGDDDSFTVISPYLTKASGTVDITNFAGKGGNFTTNGNLKYQRRTILSGNTSGGTINAGEVVVISSSDPAKVTTTTTAGDPKVVGMALRSITSAGDNVVLTEGFTDVLKVDGTTDIAIGDLLTTFTTAGIAAKASAGQVAFAIAMEAYTGNDSNGVIDALLIPPRTA